MTAPVKCRGCGEVRATSCGAADCPVPLQASGDLDGLGLPTNWRGPAPATFEVVGLGPFIPHTATERVIPDPFGPLTEHIIALADAFYLRTGRHGITRISLTPDVGLAFGIAPGTSVDVQTSAGRVEVYAERTPRFEGVVQIDLTEGRDGG